MLTWLFTLFAERGLFKTDLGASLSSASQIIPNVLEVQLQLGTNVYGPALILKVIAPTLAVRGNKLLSGGWAC